MVEFGNGIALAIDFGSSNTAAAFRDRHGHVQEVRLSATGTLMPSGVFFDGSRFLVGRTALQAAFTSPEAFEPSPKRRLADREIFLAGSMVPVTKMVAAVFAEVLAKSGGVMGGAPDVIVVTHPDQWSGPLTELLAEGARAGGVDPNRMRMVSEAQAAAWFYAKSAPNEVPVGSRLVVFDFGAGTCDVAVLDKQPDQTFAVIASDGLDGLGGQDLDARIQAWVRRQLAVSDPVLLAEVNEPASIATRLTLNDRVRDAKEALSEASSAAIVVAAGANTQVLQLTRDEFDELIGADIGRAVDLTKRVMAEANERVPASQTPTIYLTGGSSYIPLVHSRLAELAPLGVLGDPKTVVVQGALYTPQASPAGPAQPPAPPPPPPPPPPPSATPAPAPQPSYAGYPAMQPAGSPTAVPNAGPSPAAFVDSGRIPVPEPPPNGKPANPMKKWLIAGGGVAALAITAVIVLFATGAFNGGGAKPVAATTTTTTAPPLPVNRLTSLLLSDSQINTIMKTQGIKAYDISDHLTAASDKFGDPKCAGTLYSAQPSVYSGSGYTGASDQILKEFTANNALNYFVEQTAVAYPTTEAAQTFVKGQSDLWKSCANTALPVTSTNSDGTPNNQSWSIADVKTDNDTISQVQTQEAANGWACQHSMRAVNNVVLDVSACSHSLSNEASDIAAKMATNAAS
jgi:hypothetical protein